MSEYLFVFRQGLPRRTYIAVACTSVISFLLVWAVVEKLAILPSDYVPSPHRVVIAAVTMFSTYNFTKDVLVSSGRIGAAFLISAILAVPLGLLMSSFKFIEAFVEPIVDFVRYVPVPALLPIFVLWSGIGETSKFLVLFFGTFFQLVLLIMDDADNVPRVYFELARTMGASTPYLIRDILVPYLLPQIYDRLRVTVGWCWTYLIIAELVAVERGVGHAIKEAQRFNAADQMFVCFIVLGIIGLLTDYLAKFSYSRFFPYASKAALQTR